MTAHTPGETHVDPTLRRIVVLFRVLGWSWMALLIVLELAAGAIDRIWVALVALAVASAWTMLTFWAARSHDRLGSVPFVVADGIIALAIGVVSPLAASGELIHGGYPMSWVILAAYIGGVRLAVPGSLLFAVEQWIVRIEVLDRSPSGAAFSVVFIVFAIVAGWAFDALREHSTRLAEVEADRARFAERAELAERLHDSVLQTLHAIGTEADEPDRVRYLARRQERELRRTIDEYLSPHPNSFRVALLAARDDVEDLHRVKIETVIRDDLPLTDGLSTVVEAAREAMLNAARHSGASLVNVYSEAVNDSVTVMVRDRGTGFEPGTALGGEGHGLTRSLVSRVERCGGKVAISSTLGEGTEIVISLPHPDTSQRGRHETAQGR